MKKEKFLIGFEVYNPVLDNNKNEIENENIVNFKLSKSTIITNVSYNNYSSCVDACMKFMGKINAEIGRNAYRNFAISTLYNNVNKLCSVGNLTSSKMHDLGLAITLPITEFPMYVNIINKTYTYVKCYPIKVEIEMDN